MAHKISLQIMLENISERVKATLWCSHTF